MMPSASRSPSGWCSALPDEVRVVDFGIRGLDLTYALLDGYEAVVLVDAVPAGVRREPCTFSNRIAARRARPTT